MFTYVDVTIPKIKTKSMKEQMIIFSFSLYSTLIYRIISCVHDKQLLR